MLYPVGDISFRGYTAKDAEFLKSLYIDKDYQVYFRDQPNYKTMEDFERYVEITGSTVFVIEKKGQPIGLLSLYDYRQLIRSIKFGVLFTKEHQKQGNAIATSQITLDYVFGRLNLNKIESITVDFDVRLTAILKKMNFSVEGVLKDEAYFDGSYHDCVLMGLTRKAYEESR